VKEALLDIRTWLYFFISMSYVPEYSCSAVADSGRLNIPNGGLGGFYSIVIQGLDFSVKELTLLNIPTGVIGWLAAMFWVTVAKYTRQPLLCAIGSVIGEYRCRPSLT
jgi:ACS family allantoate permease-like MFS transporter